MTAVHLVKQCSYDCLVMMNSQVFQQTKQETYMDIILWIYVTARKRQLEIVYEKSEKSTRQ